MSSAWHCSLRCTATPGGTKLTDACSDFLLIHAVDLRDELHALTPDHLCMLFQSEFFWVQSEYEKFKIVMDVFESKLEAHSFMAQCEGVETGVASLPISDLLPPTGEVGSDVIMGQASNRTIQSGTKKDSKEMVESAFNECLCGHINYSSFSLEEMHLAFARINGMKMPAVITALTAGMLKAQTLQSYPCLGETAPNFASKDLDMCRDVGWFRIGVEVPFHELDAASGEEWMSPVYCHGGRGWEVSVSRGTKAIGVFVCCRELTRELACKDSSGRCSACVRFICKRRRCERRACSFEVNMKSWGAREFISIDKLDQYFTCTGTLRLTVAVKLIFSSGEEPSPL
eukprot:evm.model.scf_519EXC.4 EVM.evm.TU.scf_519EXC.4   scf_519EXC:22298-23326(+)